MGGLKKLTHSFTSPDKKVSFAEITAFVCCLVFVILVLNNLVRSWMYEEELTYSPSVFNIIMVCLGYIGGNKGIERVTKLKSKQHDL